MILTLLAASVFGLALLMQHLYENDPGFRAWFEPETPEPPPYYADYAYEPLGGRPIRVSLNGVAFNLPRGRGMSFALVLDGEVRRVDFSPRGFERNPYQQQMLAMLEERHDAVPIIGFGLFNFGSDTGSPCRPDNGDWNVRFCRKAEALYDGRFDGNFQWQKSLHARSTRNRFYVNLPSFHRNIFDNEEFREEIEEAENNFKRYSGCLDRTRKPGQRYNFENRFCETRLYHTNNFLVKSNYVVNSNSFHAVSEILQLKSAIVSELFD